MRSCSWLMLLALACGGGDVSSGGRRDAGSDGTVPADHATPADGSGLDVGPGDLGSPDDERAFLHADLWSVWWNDRTRCGAERTFLQICQQRGDECSRYQSAYDVCDPTTVIYGQVGPEKQSERLCRRGSFPDIGGCVAAAYDFDRLQFHWYGAEWQGNWPVATLKVFEGSVTDPAALASDGLIALSNVPGAAQAAMSGIDNHGVGSDPCVMLGETSGAAAFQTPFGAFAWVEVPTGRTVTVAAMAATNFGDMAFAGCNRGGATQDPWITGAPASQLGCVYVQELTFEPGAHYAFRHGRIERLATPTVPADIAAGFAAIGVDASGPGSCR